MELVLKDHPIGHKNVVCQNKWPLSVILKCRTFDKMCGPSRQVVSHGCGLSRQISLYSLNDIVLFKCETNAFYNTPLFPFHRVKRKLEVLGDQSVCELVAKTEDDTEILQVGCGILKLKIIYIFSRY